MGWTKGPNGAAVWQDDAGLVHVKDAGGRVQALPAHEALDLLSHDYTGFAPASAADLNAAREAEAAKAAEAQSSTLGAAARHVAIGAVGGVLAPGKLVSGLATSGLNALGADVQDPLRNISGRQVVTDVQAIGSELTGGNAEVAGREAREQILRDEAIHPVASILGEIGGNVASGAATGGGTAALASKGAAALGLAGRAATVAANVGGAVIEGAGLGADAASEQAWVRNEPVTAEQTLAGIGLGGLFGGLAAGTMAAAAPALSKFLGRGAAKAEAAGAEGALLRESGELGTAEAAAVPGRATIAAEETVMPAALETVPEKARSRAREWLSGLGDDAAVRQIAHDQKPALRDLGGGKPPTPEVRADAGRFLNESGIAGLGSDSAALERATAVSESAGQKIGAIMEAMDQKAPYVEARPMVNKLQDFARELEKTSWTPEQDAIAKKIMDRTVKIEELADAGIVTHSDLWNYRRGLDTLSGWGKTAPNATKEAMRELRTMVESQLEKSIAEGGQFVGSDAGAEYLAAKRAYRFSTWAKDALEERVGVRSMANNLLGLKDFGVGAAAFIGSGGAALPALAGAVGTKIIRERGWGTLAYLARRAAADAVDVTAAPAGAQQTARAIQSMVAKSESHISSRIGKFLGTGVDDSVSTKARATTAAALRATSLSSAQSAYQDHAREVQQVAAVPDVAASRLAGITGQHLQTVAPGLHASMAAVTVRAANYLKDNMPAPPTDPDSVTPQLDEPPPVSHADLETYADRVEGVEDPLSLMDDLDKGSVSPEKVDAIKNVWPELFARMRQATFNSLSQRTKEQGPIDHDRLLMLDLALDANGAIEPSLRPESLAIMKQASEYQAQQQKQNNPRPSGAAPKLGNMVATQSDRIAMH